MDIPIGIAAALLIVAWLFIAVHHRFFLPQIDPRKLQSRIEFFAAVQGIVLDPTHPLPIISIMEQKDLLLLLPLDKAMEYTAIFSLWVPEWNKFLFSRGYDREDTLAHEVGHYLRHTYGGHCQNTDEEDHRAECLVRVFFQTFYPKRYAFFMFLYGIFGLWGFDITKDRMFSSPQTIYSR